MEEFVLPASPNWFLPTVSSGNEEGLYAFASRNDIFVYDISMIDSSATKQFAEIGTSVSAKRHPPKLIAFHSEHTGKVNAVCLSPDPSQRTCCSCQEDLIKLWDVRSLVTIQETYQTENKAKFTCMSWSSGDPDAVFAGSDKGTVWRWKLKSNALSSFDCSREYILSIAASPHSAHVVALGCRSGNASVVSFEKEKAMILHRLRGHDAEIYSICWCPIKGENFATPEWLSKEGALLATAGRRCVRVWSANRGKEIFHIKLQQSFTGSRDASDPFSKKSWVDVVWSKQIPHHIIFTGSNGDLFYVDIHHEGQQEPERFSYDAINKHARMIFNVVEASGKLCTFSLDRNIAVWDNKTKSGLVSWSSFAGHVFCARVSPLDPGRIAIGAGDNNIRVWNQNNRSNPGEIAQFYNGLRSKITHVAWHPEKEGVLAYGTEDGNVGIYNTLSPKLPQMSSTYHKNTVYVVSWAPALKVEDAESTQFQVYSVGDGTVLQHFIDQSKRDAINVVEAVDEVNDKPQKHVIVSELSWRQDYTAFGLGRIDGSVVVYKFPSLRLLCRVEIQTKLINCLRWHPPETAQSPLGSPCSGLLAFGGNDGFVSLVDLSHVSDTGVDLSALLAKEQPTKEPLLVTQGQGRLQSNSIRITDLCWSPHKDGVLVSVGYSGAAVVWNARTCEQLASYRHEIGRLLTVVWSHLDPDFIMTGGTDGTFRKWRVSAQPKGVQETAKKKKKKKASRQPLSAAAAVSANDGLHMEETEEIKQLQELLRLKERQLLAQIKSGDGVSEQQAAFI